MTAPILRRVRSGILARDQNGGPNFNAKVKTVLVFFEFGGAYRIIGQPPSVGATGLSSFWLEPRVRYTHNKNRFDVRVAQETTDFDQSTNFADPSWAGVWDSKSSRNWRGRSGVTWLRSAPAQSRGHGRSRATFATDCLGSIVHSVST
jgi:hypothetical protein